MASNTPKMSPTRTTYSKIKTFKTIKTRLAPSAKKPGRYTGAAPKKV